VLNQHKVVVDNVSTELNKLSSLNATMRAKISKRAGHRVELNGQSRVKGTAKIEEVEREVNNLQINNYLLKQKNISDLKYIQK
jgi:hypothetical protein